MPGQNYRKIIWVIGTLMLFIGGVASEGAVGLSTVEDFEDISDWTLQDGSQNGVVVERSTDYVHSGTYSLKFRPAVDGYTAYGHSYANKVWLEDAREFGLWVYGDGSGVQLNWQLKDNYGEIYQSPDIIVNWTGWQRITWIPSNANEHWGGSGGTAGVIDYPIAFNSLIVGYKNPQPTLYFDELTAVGTFKFGVEDHGPGSGPYGVVSADAQLDDLENCNMSYVRLDFPNEPYESNDWSKIDAMVDGALAHGIRVFGVMGGYRNDYTSSYNKAYAVASRYGSDVDYYQLSNELCSDCLGGDYDGTLKSHYNENEIDEVIAMIKGLYDGIKAGNPAARTVLNIAFKHYGFLDWCKDKGAKWDISGVDWYSDAEQYPDYTSSVLTSDGLEGILSELYRRFKKNVWVCESGLKDSYPGWTEDLHAGFIKVQAEAARAQDGCTGYFVYELYSSGAEDYGIVRVPDPLAIWDGIGSYSVVNTPVIVGGYSAKLDYDFALNGDTLYGGYSNKFIEDFRNIADWTCQDGSQNGVVVEQATTPVYYRIYSLKFRPAVDGYTAYGHSDANKVWLNHASEFGVWVYGDGSGVQLNWQLKDNYGEIYQSSDIIVNWTGWQRITWIPSNANEHWGGSGGTAGVIDYPIAFNSLIVGYKNPQPTLYFDSLTARVLCNNQFQVRLYGNNSGDEVRIRFTDMGGETFSKVVTLLDFSEWSLKSVDINTTGADFWGGSGGTPGVIDYPVKFNSTHIRDFGTTGNSGQIYIDEITGDGSKILDFECTKRLAYDAYAVTTQVENFEDISDWTFHDGSQTGIVVAQSTNYVHSGEYSLQFRPAVDSYTAYGHSYANKVWLEDAREFGLWVYGDGSGVQLNWQLKDNYGEIYQSPDIIVNWTGWQRITWIPSNANEHWGGSGGTAGVIDYPIAFNSLIVGYKNPQPTLYFDELTHR